MRSVLCHLIWKPSKSYSKVKCKNSFPQNIIRFNWKVYKKNYVYWSTGIYSRCTRLFQYLFRNQGSPPCVQTELRKLYEILSLDKENAFDKNGKIMTQTYAFPLHQQQAKVTMLSVPTQRCSCSYFYWKFWSM